MSPSIGTRTKRKLFSSQRKISPSSSGRFLLHLVAWLSFLYVGGLFVCRPFRTSHHDDLAVVKMEALEPYQKQSNSNASLRKNEQPISSSTESTPSRPIPVLSSTPSICPNIPFDLESVQMSIQENNLFHKQGGNLKSVEKFRDSSVDDTMKKLRLNFVPNKGKPTQRLSWFLGKYYARYNDARGGYGKPLPGKFVRRKQQKQKRIITLSKINKNNTNNNKETEDQEQEMDHMRELFEGRWIEPIEDFKGRGKWAASLGPIGPTCPDLIQVGIDNGQDHKWFCQHNDTEKNIIDNNDEESNETCHVISVGGNDNWIFEQQVTKTFGCITHTFDCTLPNNTPRRKPKDNDKIRFYPHCLDGHSHTDSHGRSYLTYWEILQKAGLSSPPLYFKIDVEGFEYNIFSQMMRDISSSPLHSANMLPVQIQVELHWATRMTGVEWMTRTKSAGEIALFSSMMYNTGGYMPIHLGFHRGCSACMEVLYYRVLC